MSSIITDLYRGEIQLRDCVYSDDSDVAIHHRAVGEIRERMGKSLNESTAEQLSQLTDCYEKLIEAESSEAFRQGFALGVGLVMEVHAQLSEMRVGQ